MVAQRIRRCGRASCIRHGIPEWGRESRGERVGEYSRPHVSVGSTVIEDRRSTGTPDRGCDMRTLEGCRTQSRYRTAGTVAALALCVLGVAGCDRTSGGSESPTSSVTETVPGTLPEPAPQTAETTGWSEATSYLETTPYETTPYVVPTHSYGPRPTPITTTPAPTTTQLPTTTSDPSVGGPGSVVPPEDVPVPDE